MAGMGPPPKPPGTRARRNAAPQTTTLPALGRRGKKAPEWPLRADASATRMQMAAELRVQRLRDELNATSDRRKVGRLERQLDMALSEAEALERQLAEQAELELALWVELWTTPQATMWERYGWYREVATYVRWQIKNELGDLDAAKEARQWSDRLGLNPMALLRLRWQIEQTDEAEQRGKTRRQSAAAGEKPPARKAADPRAALYAVK
jgi:hypothetical protein